MAMDSNDPARQGLSSDLESIISTNPVLQDLPRDYQAILDHIMFHKALLSDESDGEKLNNYVDMISDLEYGTHVAIEDPYDKSIAITFELASKYHLDPWDIDLAKFSKAYITRIKEHEELDLVTAGRIIFMAWSILKLQSDEVLSNAERVEEEEPDIWSEPGGDWYIDNVDFANTEMIKHRKKQPLQEMVWHKGARPVTLLELVGAFEEARKEAEVMKVLNEKRRLQRDYERRLYRSNINTNMHKEDLEADITMVYDRICQFNGHPIPISKIIMDDVPGDEITALISALYLANRRMINVWQPEFPNGVIYIENLRDKKEKAPPLPGEPAEDLTFRALRAKARQEMLEHQKFEELKAAAKEKRSKEKDNKKKKKEMQELVKSKKGLAS